MTIDERDFVEEIFKLMGVKFEEGALTHQELAEKLVLIRKKYTPTFLSSPKKSAGILNITMETMEDTPLIKNAGIQIAKETSSARLSDLSAAIKKTKARQNKKK